MDWNMAAVSAAVFTVTASMSPMRDRAKGDSPSWSDSARISVEQVLSTATPGCFRVTGVPGSPSSPPFSPTCSRARMVPYSPAMSCCTWAASACQ